MWVNYLKITWCLLLISYSSHDIFIILKNKIHTRLNIVKKNKQIYLGTTSTFVSDFRFLLRRFGIFWLGSDSLLLLGPLHL